MVKNMEKIHKTIKTKYTFWDRIKLVFKKNKNYYVIEDPVDFDAWLLLKEIKAQKKRKKLTVKKFFVSLWYNYKK